MRHFSSAFKITAIAFLFFLPCLSLPAEVSAPVVEIEKNVLYMVPLGEKDGIRSGDTAEVMRDKSKIARLQFTSVLVDSAMAEVVELFDAEGIQDTDVAVCSGGAKAGTVATKPKAEARVEEPVEPVAKVKKEPVLIEVVEDVSVEVVEEKKVPLPPQEEILKEESYRESSRQKELQKKNIELQAEVKRLTQERGSESSGLRAELQQKETDADRLNREKTKMEFELNQSKQEVDELKQELASLKQEMIPLKAMSVRTSKDGKDPFEKKVEDLNKTLVTLQRQCQEDVSVAREESRQELYNEYGRWEEKLNETKQLYEDQIEKYKTALREKDSSVEEVRNEKFGLSAKLGSTEQEANELRDKLKIVEEELETIKSARSEKLSLTEDALRNKIDEVSDLKGEYEEKVAALKKEHETAFGALKVKSEADIKQLREGSQKEIVDLKTQYEAELKQLRESSQKEIGTLKNQQSAKIQQAKDDAHKIFLQEKGQLLSKMSQMETDDKAQLSAAQKSVDEKAAALSEREALVTFLKGEKDKLAEGLRTSEDTVKELRSENARVQEELRSAKASAAEQIKSATDVLSQEVTNLKSREEALKKELDGKLTLAQESALRETESLKSLHEKRLEDARLEYEKKFKTQDDRMVEKDNVIASLREQNALVASEIEKKNVQISNLKEENADLNGQVRSVKIPLQEKIEGLNRVIFSLESTYEEKLKTVKEKAEADFKKSQEEGGVKLAQAEGRIAPLEAKVKEQDAKIGSLTNENSNLKEDVKRRDSTISGLEGELAGVKQELRDERSSMAEKMLAGKAPLEAMIEKLTKETDSLKIKYEQKLKEERDLAQANLDKKAKESQDEIAQVQAQAQEKIAVLNSDLEKLAKGKDEYINTMLSELKDKQSIITLLTTKKDELEGSLASSKKEVSTVTEEFSKAKSDLASTTASFEKTIEELNSKLALAQKESEEKLAAQQRDSQQQLSLEETQYETALQTMRNEYEAKLANQKREMEEILIDRETKLTEDISKGSEQANEFKNQTEKKMHAFAAELEEKRALIDSLNKEKQDLSLRLEEKNQKIVTLSHDAGRLAEELKGAKNISAEKMRIIQDPLEAKIKELERQLASAQQGRSMEVANKEKEFSRVRDSLEKELATFKKMHEEKIVALKTESKRELDDNEEKWQARLDSTVKEYERLVNIKTKGVEDRLDARQTDLKTTLAKTMEDSQRALQLNDEQWQKKVLGLEKSRDAREGELQAKYVGEVSDLRKQVAMLESQVKTGDVQISEMLKGRDQRIETLIKEKDVVSLDLEETRKQFLAAKEELINFKASQAEAIRSATAPLEDQIRSLGYEMAALKKESDGRVESASGDARIKLQEREHLWEAKYGDLKKRYEDELLAQRRSLEDKLGRGKEALQAELENLREEFVKLKDDKESELFSLQVGYEDEIRAVKEESQQKINDLMQDFTEGQELQGDMKQHSTAAMPDAGVQPSSPALDSTGYFNLVRKMILDSIQDVDIMSYKSDEEYVKIEFELYADGSLKTAPQFLGTNNADLKESLYQYFLKALPFPPFPESIKKKSQRFTIVISFKTDAT